MKKKLPVKTRMNPENKKLPRGVAQFPNASSNLFTLNDILFINVLFYTCRRLYTWLKVFYTHPLYQLTYYININQ